MYIKLLQNNVGYLIAEPQISVLNILLWKYLEYIPLILLTYKQLKSAKIVRFRTCSILSVPQKVVQTVE